MFKPCIKVFKKEGLADKFVANEIFNQVVKKPNSVIILPTGMTQVGMYKILVNLIIHHKTDLSKVIIFNLDEYCPIKQTSPNSYYTYMNNHLFNKIHTKPKYWFIPNGEVTNVFSEVKRLINAFNKYGPADLAILGLGPGKTCHIGFNEKGSTRRSKIRYVKLDKETIRANSKYFDNPIEFPEGAITLGIYEILKSEKIILFAKNKEKAWGIKRSLLGSVSSNAPASFLKLHKNTIIVLNASAACLIK